MSDEQTSITLEEAERRMKLQRARDIAADVLRREEEAHEREAMRNMDPEVLELREEINRLRAANDHLKAALNEVKALRTKSEDELNRRIESKSQGLDLRRLDLDSKLRAYKDAERIIRRHMRAAKA